MDVAKRLETLASQWAAHCQRNAFSSRLSDYLNHESFRELTGLGRTALPGIMKRLASDDALPWVFVVQAISGVTFVDDPGDYSPAEARQRCLQWWDREATQVQTRSTTS